MKLPVFNYNIPKNQANVDVLDVYIDGDIVDAATQEFYKNWWGDDTTTSYKSFREAMLSSTASRINININSGGGQMADAFAMHDFIKENIANGKNWHTYGKGVVASAATYPLLAGGPDNMHISENCFVMIHNASGGIYGSVDEIESYAATMRKFNNTARDLYANYFSKPKETISNWMNTETWWTGTDMKNMGLITEKNCGPAENAFKNSIPKEKWLFTDTAVLNTINNSITVPKEKGMKKNKIGIAINEAFAKFFNKDTNLATTSPDDLKAAIIDALNTQDDDEVDPVAITNAVTQAMGGDAFNTAVANSVRKALETVPENITKAITDATSGLATTDSVVTTETFNSLKEELADKLGAPLNKKNKGPKNEADEKFDHEDITWGNEA